MSGEPLGGGSRAPGPARWVPIPTVNLSASTDGGPLESRGCQPARGQEALGWSCLERPAGPALPLGTSCVLVSVVVTEACTLLRLNEHPSRKVGLYANYTPGS